jgi:NAD(P)-dependent dehydrogenase (short-subunit alcohol dehydrogenase family)
MRELFDLKGKVALVTGAGSGIGRAIALALADFGAIVAAADISGERCGAVQAELEQSGTRALGIRCDVTNRKELRRMVDETVRLFGRIDILVCNAGINTRNGSLLDASDEDWDRIMTTNLRSALWLIQMVAPLMVEQKDGSIILMASLSSLRGNKSIGMYSLSKAGLAQLARNLAVELGPDNVRVNAISPGLIDTPFSHGMLSNPEVMARRLAMTPLRRVGKPEEIAGVAVLLASRAGAFITGQNIVVDGGTIITDGN